MWCTSGQFLDILAGDWGEHAVLLWNYFQWLKVNGKWPGNRDDVIFYLVIGRAIPEGNTVYVLQYYPGDPRTAVFWNACTGHAYGAGDPRCPLQVRLGLLGGSDLQNSSALVHIFDNFFSILRSTVSR